MHTAERCRSAGHPRYPANRMIQSERERDHYGQSNSRLEDATLELQTRAVFALLQKRKSDHFAVFYTFQRQLVWIKSHVPLIDANLMLETGRVEERERKGRKTRRKGLLGLCDTQQEAGVASGCSPLKRSSGSF